MIKYFKTLALLFRDDDIAFLDALCDTFCDDIIARDSLTFARFASRAALLFPAPHDDHIIDTILDNFDA